jgi:hypothetical protein
MKNTGGDQNDFTTHAPWLGWNTGVIVTDSAIVRFNSDRPPAS